MEPYYIKRFKRKEEKKQKRLLTKTNNYITKEEALSSMPVGSDVELWERAVNSVGENFELKDVIKMYKFLLKTKLNIYGKYKIVKESLNDKI